MHPQSSLHAIEGDKEDGAKGLRTPSSVHCSCETPRCGGGWENDSSQNPERWVFEYAWLRYR